MKFLMLLVICAACASDQGKLSNKAKDIEVFTNKPANCNVIGKVVGMDSNGSTELAMNHALNQAAKLGANGLHVNQEVPNGKSRSVYATAYDCN